MRIVGGIHRGRKVVAPEGGTARPTADRVREALFNILTHAADFELEGARVVDCFAGTGAVGLEALSRGAAKATFLESDPKSLAALQANIRTLDEEERSEVVRGDATRPPRAAKACDLVFLDAPYGSGIAGPAMEALAQHGWLKPAAIIVVEVAAKEAFAAPPGFEITDERRYGAARLVFLERTGF